MYIIRAYEESDLEFVRQRDVILSLEIPYCSEFSEENVFTALNENKDVVGVITLSSHYTWNDPSEEADHKMVLNYCVEESEVLPFLLKKAKERFDAIVRTTGKKNCKLVLWFDEGEILEIQTFLHEDFLLGEICPVLKYDLTKEIKQRQLPEGYTIEKLEINDENVSKYLNATALANEGCPDSEGELRFRSFDQSFEIYVLKVGETIVSSMTLWNIGEERSATENIFTIPEYQKQGLAKQIIGYGLQVLKDRGKKIATLSMRGTNRRAMRLYQSLGYELMYCQLEVQYLPLEEK